MDSKYPDSHQDVIEGRKCSTFHDEHNKNNETGETIDISDFIVACILVYVSIPATIYICGEATKVDGFRFFCGMSALVLILLMAVSMCGIIIFYIITKIKHITSKQLAKIKSKSKIKFNHD